VESDVPFWQKGLMLLAVLWAFQAVGTWVQMRHYRRVLGEIARSWPDGYLGAHAVRSYLGKGVIAIVVATPDDIVRQVLVMEGRSVFAKFKACPEDQGLSLNALATVETTTRHKSRRRAVEGAIAQIRQAAAGRAAAAAIAA
jgi:glucitol operon activator protein